MDFTIVILSFIAGLLAYHTLFQPGPGPFEKTIWTGLREGKRVVVSIGNEAFIFEMTGSRLKISRATADFIEESNDGMVADNLSTERVVEPANPGPDVL